MLKIDHKNETLLEIIFVASTRSDFVSSVVGNIVNDFAYFNAAKLPKNE